MSSAAVICPMMLMCAFVARMLLERVMVPSVPLSHADRRIPPRVFPSRRARRSGVENSASTSKSLLSAGRAGSLSPAGLSATKLMRPSPVDRPSRIRSDHGPSASVIKSRTGVHEVPFLPVPVFPTIREYSLA